MSSSASPFCLTGFRLLGLKESVDNTSIQCFVCDRVITALPTTNPKRIAKMQCNTRTCSYQTTDEFVFLALQLQLLHRPYVFTSVCVLSVSTVLPANCFPPMTTPRSAWAGTCVTLPAKPRDSAPNADSAPKAV